jgi:hypothetical protein
MISLKGVGNEPAVDEATRFIQVRTRLDRAVQLKPTKIGQGLYEVPSQRGRGVYVVDLLGKTCTCMDYTIRGVLCKHILAAKLADDMMPGIIEKNFHYEECY